MSQNDRSAEFYRGAIAEIEAWRFISLSTLEQRIQDYRALLAAAEAREAPAPEVIPGTHAALAGLSIREARQIAVRATEVNEAGLKAEREREAWILSQNTEPKPHDWFHSGLSPHPCCRVCGILQRRDGRNSPCKGPTSIATREATQPTAAEVKAQIISEYIDLNSTTCDCCGHVMIDVTAARKGGRSHCVAGDPEGDGSGCAWGMHQDLIRPISAADVINDVDQALKRVVGLDYMGDPDVAIQSFPNLKVTPMQAAEELYELRSILARWKEANGDGSNTR